MAVLLSFLVALFVGVGFVSALLIASSRELKQIEEESTSAHPAIPQPR